MNITQIKNFVATEYTAATAEVHNFVAWLEGKNNELNSAVAAMNSALPVLQKAGYVITITPPPAA
jgi:hypothetical protein